MMVFKIVPRYAQPRTIPVGPKNNDGKRNKSEIFDIGTDIAGSEYDVATVHWGGMWQMPTRNQYQELIDNCTLYNGVWCFDPSYECGIYFVGPNGNSIFFPKAGYKVGDGHFEYGNNDSWNAAYGYYWTSSLSSIDKRRANSFSIFGDYQWMRCYFNGMSWSNGNESGYIPGMERNTGQSIRPVSR